MGYGHGFGLQRRRRLGGAPPLAAYSWALDFTNGRYRNGAQLVTDMSLLSGYHFSRTGLVSEQYPQGAMFDFAADMPALVPGHGYVQRASHSNLLLNAGQSSLLATQSIAMTNGQSYTLAFIGTGSVTLSGAATGSLAGTGANDRVRLTVTAGSTGSTTLTVSGDVRFATLTGTATQGPIIPTGGTAATAPAGDLWFTAPDLSGDWLLTLDLDFLESNAAIAIEETLLSINDGTTANRIYLTRNTSGGILRGRRTVAGGSTVNAATSATQPGTGRSLMALRKAGNDYAVGAIPAGGSYAAASFGTLTGWSAAFSRVDIGKMLNANIAHAAHRFVGIELGTFTDPQMQARLEARL